uniref:C5 protein n=1 Tax=Begomovirus alternantherae TaxID=337826 RepID=A0A6G7AFC7_9GEMI|nr:C5 protein [Alternanthera yellow vein virus]
MGNPTTSSNIRDTQQRASMTNVMFFSKRLDLTWTLTAIRHIRASVHSVQPWLAIHGTARPLLFSSGTDNGGSSTASHRAVEVEPTSYPRSA